MTEKLNTIAIEDQFTPPFFKKIPIAIERGQGVYAWDENGRKYIDFTSGWGVTCIGHASPVITSALLEQSKKIIQNPSSGLTYSPPRARLLVLLRQILPANLTRIFFANSGAEANDAVIKLARKVTGRLNIIASLKGFHGRTISTASATGQAKHREKFNPLMPNYIFVPYNDIAALKREMNASIAAVLLEPIQGEGGVNPPKEGYLEKVSELCVKNNSCLIIDEVQTGFCRTGTMFAVDKHKIKVDFLTLAKGIAGGFPFGAFAVSEEVSARLERGDHGGTYCGNPLGCAVAHAVIKYLVDEKIGQHVQQMGGYFLDRMQGWRKKYPKIIKEVRGMGLLLAMELATPDIAARINSQGIEQGLFLNLTQDTVIRLFPALNITRAEADEGLAILDKMLADVAGKT